MRLLKIFGLTLLGTLAIAMWVPTAAQAQKHLVFASSHDTITRISIRVLTEAYQHLGITVITKDFPNRRAPLLVASGKLDGLVNRIKNFDKQATGIIRVPEAVNYFTAMAHTSDKNITITGWDSLKPLRVGILLARAYAEQATKGWPNVFVQPTFDKLFDLLEAGRLDVVVASSIEGHNQRTRMVNSTIKPNGPPLQTFQLYHHLAERHAALVPKLTAVLESMKRKGRLKEIREQVIAERFGGDLF